MDALRLVTWNIHRGRGADGAVRPPRVTEAIARHIAPLKPDILALTEADAERGSQPGLLDLARVEAATGLVHAHPPELRWGDMSHGFHGCVVFLRPALAVTHAALIDLPGLWPRGAVALDLAGPPELRLVVTHLALGQALRMAQMRTLGQFRQRRPPMATVIAGDLNEWRPWGGMAFSARLFGVRLTGPARATFPARRPVLPLDRVLGDRPGLVAETKVLREAAFRAASDHLPLFARLDLRAAATSG